MTKELVNHVSENDLKCIFCFMNGNVPQLYSFLNANE